MTNVLLAIDGPVCAEVLEEYVVNYKWTPGMKLKLLHIVEPMQYVDAWPQAQLDVNHYEQDRKLLEETSSRIKKALPDVDVSFEIRHGFTKEEILAEATKWPAETIVMGSHGRHGVQRFLLGSVSMSIVMHASCSVILLRIPKKARTEVSK